MVTALGEFTRSLRASCGERPAEMAKRLSVSSSMLNYIETGERNAPSDFAWRISSRYNLSDGQMRQLALAVAKTEGAQDLSLKGLGTEDGQLAVLLASALPDIPESDKCAIWSMVDKAIAGAGAIELEVVTLRDGAEKRVPSGTVILNPERTGQSSYLYMVWFFLEDRPCSPAQAWHGKSLGPLFAYASEQQGLHRCGTQVPSFSDPEEQRACGEEMATLTRKAIGASRGINRNEKKGGLRFAWVDIDTVLDTAPLFGMSACIDES